MRNCGGAWLVEFENLAAGLFFQCPSRHPCACHRGPLFKLCHKENVQFLHLSGMDSCDGHRNDGSVAAILLSHILAAIGGQGGAGDEAGIVADQENHTTGDLFRFTQTTDRNVR